MSPGHSEGDIDENHVNGVCGTTLGDQPVGQEGHRKETMLKRGHDPKKVEKH